MNDHKDALQVEVPVNKKKLQLKRVSLKVEALETKIAPRPASCISDDGSCGAFGAVADV